MLAVYNTNKSRSNLGWCLNRCHDVSLDRNEWRYVRCSMICPTWEANALLLFFIFPEKMQGLFGHFSTNQPHIHQRLPRGRKSSQYKESEGTNAHICK